jgi:sugar lactone lactonase YvrE
MLREVRTRSILAVSTALIALTASAIFYSSDVRAAESRYKQVEWAQLPPGTQWGVMSAVDVDSQGRVFVFQREPSKVMVFDSHGKLLKTWGDNEFPAAHGLNILRDGSLWLTDRKIQQAMKFSPDGKILMTIGTKGVAGDNDSKTAFDGPSQVVMAKNGNLFVSDGEGPNTRVVKFSKDGKFIKYWGTKGDGPGQLSNVHCIAMDSEGRLYVCNRANKRIEIFDQEGKYLGQLAQFGAPASIAIGKDDTLYVAAGAPEQTITIGTKDGKVLDKIEGLNAPHMLSVDSSGAIYVAQVAGKSVLKFVKQ